MSEISHTPGPWHRNIQPARKYPTIWAGRNTHVAVVVAGAPRGSGSGETLSDDELEANINLIAAAPDMLAALKRILAGREVGDPHDYGSTIVVSLSLAEIDKICEAAIAKAEGRS